jgi:7-carboxy-7-deazaguanine synthase
MPAATQGFRGGGDGGPHRSVKISEIFYSLQGEGGLVGMPSIFVRTSGCNLRCRWCDTPYTSWNPEGEEMTIDAILANVRKYPATYAVVTGGEPMIAHGIGDLTARLKRAGMHVTIETAGTVFTHVTCDLLSISPKLKNSTPEGQFAAQHERLRIQPEVLSRLIAAHEYQLKFVIADRGDLEEIRALVKTLGAPKRNVILMPEGVDVAVLRERTEWVAEMCKVEGYRFTPRLHVELYGNKRGF